MATTPSGKRYFQLDHQAVSRLLTSSNGPVVRELVTVGEMVRQEAKQRVGVSAPDPVPRKKPHRPGTLRDSIVARLDFKGGKPTVMVGSEEPYAEVHHEGSRPHVIRARNASKLVFFWPKLGRIVAFPKVNHPGTKPNRFLTDAVEAVRRRYR